MKDKLLQVRVGKDFLSELEYLQSVYGLKTASETIRFIVEKEYKKETKDGWIKSIELVETENILAEVYTLSEFANMIESDSINRNDGQGYFHDGISRTKYSVFNDNLTWEDVSSFPYVLWYPK